MDHFFRGSGCFSGYQMNSRKSFLFLNPAASAKCFQNAKLPARSGNTFPASRQYLLVWIGMVLPAMACGCMQPQDFPSGRSSYNILGLVLINCYILRSAAFLLREVKLYV